MNWIGITYVVLQLSSSCLELVSVYVDGMEKQLEENNLKLSQFAVVPKRTTLSQNKQLSTGSHSDLLGHSA